MSAFVVSGWGASREADRRFSRLVRGLLVAYLVAGIAIPFIRFAKIEEKPQPDNARYVTLLPPAPKPVPVAPQPKPVPAKSKPTPKPQAQPKPELTQEQKVQQARDKAMQKMQALNRQFADLRDRNITAMDSTRAISSSDAAVAKNDNRLGAFADTATKSSSGIATHAPGQQHGQTQLGQRQTTTIGSPIGYGRDTSKAAASGDGASGGGRGTIQQTFDRASASFYAIFMRAMRENPNIKPGKLVVTLTIAPDGSVADCKVISNTIGDAAVADKVIARIKLLNFGPKSGPPEVVPNYPIVFQPA